MSGDLTVTFPPHVNGIALFADGEVICLRDSDGGDYLRSEWTNPIKAAVLAARLRSWADLIERNTSTGADQ